MKILDKNGMQLVTVSNALAVAMLERLIVGDRLTIKLVTDAHAKLYEIIGKSASYASITISVRGRTKHAESETKAITVAHVKGNRNKLIKLRIEQQAPTTGAARLTPTPASSARRGEAARSALRKPEVKQARENRYPGRK